MTYAPLSAFSYLTANNISGPAIVLPTRDGRETFLVTGGPQPMLCFLDGPISGEGFEALTGVRWSGLAFKDIEFHVDLSSRSPYSLIDIPLGALIVHDQGTDIVINVRNGHGFSDARRFPIADGTNSSDRSEDIVFSRWKAFQRRDDELHEVYEFTSQRTGNA